MTKCAISINKKVETANVARRNIHVSQARKPYRLYSNETLYESLLRFFLQTKQEPLHVFAEKENISRSTFRRFYIESGLQQLKQTGSNDEVHARSCLNAYFETKSKNRSKRAEKATKCKRYLTDDEELSIIHLCRLLGAMGYGLSSDELQGIVTDVTNFDVDEQERVEVSEKIARGLFSRHGELLKIVQASSLDPKHAKQASKEMRDGMFAKLDSYIHLLNAMGLVSWQSYQEIPPHCLYNMDELGNDTTKHRKKVIVGKKEQSQQIRTFVKTPEGDGRMPFHITVCLTMWADGE